MVSIVLLVILASTHDMWRDEVRAFSVATRPPSWSAMLAALHEEGHPVIWYAILRAGYAMFGTVLVLPAAALVIGVTAAWVILREAPFPFAVRLLTVFGAFLGYELSIVARNYGIGVLFLVAACALYEKRAERPWLLGIALALLANTSVHASAAAAVIAAIWATDLISGRSRINVVTTLASLALVGGAIVLALDTARPQAEMAYAFDWSSLSSTAIREALLQDPGAALRGVNGANLVASGELPWARAGLDRDLVSRILVNVAVVSIAWGLRRNIVPLIGYVVAVLGFELIFRIIYPGGLRHNALLAFLMIAVCWIAIVTSKLEDRDAATRRISFGLLPLLILQAVALPFTAVRHIVNSESMGASLAGEIRTTSRYTNAVLMSEPDALMETLPYYVGNPVFFPRQREYDYRAYFDKGMSRKKLLSLGDLMAIADSVGCSTGRPVLVSIGHRSFHFDSAGTVAAPYGAIFTWNEREWAEFGDRTLGLRWYPGATSDESFRTYEIFSNCGTAELQQKGGVN